MKPTAKILVLIACVAFFAASLRAQDQPAAATPPTDAKSVSYALGVSLGTSLSNSFHFLGVSNIDAEVLTGAMKEVLAGQPTRITQKEAAAMTNSWAAQARREVAPRNLAAGKAYIEKFAMEPGVKELTNGIYYRVVKEGDGAKPVVEDMITVHYHARLVDGSEFDSSYSRNTPWDTRLNRVIKGWQLVLPNMKVGSKWDFVIPAELAYGERGTGTAVPPNSVLVYDLELLGIKTTNAPASGR
jgi:FKBP-type peptidyl-prolyl cis-trans isomerase FkpA